MQKTNTSTTVVFVAVLLLSLLAVNCNIYNRVAHFKVPSNVLDIQYSPDQKFVVLASDSMAYVYNGFTLQSVKNVSYNLAAGDAFAGLSFTQDSSKFIIGVNGNDQKPNFQVHTTGNDKQQLQILKIKGTGKINSFCVTADNSRLVLGLSTGDIYAVVIIKNQSDSSIRLEGDIPVSAVACSTWSSLQFVAAGTKDDKTVTKLKLYEINAGTEEITVKYDINSVKPQEQIRSMVFSSSGDYLYRCGNQGIYKSNIHSYVQQPIQFPQGLKDFRRIRVSAKDDVVAVSDDNLGLYINKITPKQKKYQLNTAQMMVIASPYFGLAPNGVNLFTIQDKVTNFAQVTSQCKANQYLNEATLLCQSCTTNCNACSQTSCFSCSSRFYLSKSNVCQACISYCTKCKNGLTCQTCFQTFTKDNSNKCSCTKGTYLNVNSCSACGQNCLDCSNAKTCLQCAVDFEIQEGTGACIQKSGLPAWAIVLIILLCLSVVIIIAGVIFIRMRKQKKSPLLTDSDQGEKAMVD